MVLQLNFVTGSSPLKFHDIAIAAPFIYALKNKSKIVVVVSLLPGTMKKKTPGHLQCNIKLNRLSKAIFRLKTACLQTDRQPD